VNLLAGTTYLQHYNESFPYEPKLSYITALTLTELGPPENYTGPVKDTESPNNPSSDRYVLEFAYKQMHFITASGPNITSSLYAIGEEPSQCSSVNMSKKRECGYSGIPPEFCASKSCCYEVCTFHPYALPYPQLFYCLLYTHFILICFVHVVRRGARSDRNVFTQKRKLLPLYYCIQSNDLHFMLQYCQLYQQSVGEVCLNTYQKLVVEADNGPLLLLLPELWIIAS
jgi:hypothetical protein